MNNGISETIVKEYEDIKKISEGDFSEIEKLEENPDVRRYKKLLKIRDSRFEFQNKDSITGYILSKYGQGKIEETNGVWCLIYEIPVHDYEERFNEPLNELDKDSIVLVYLDVENNQKRIVIKKDEQESFEMNHDVVVGKLSIHDELDRYYNVRHEFFDSCLKDGQGFAVQKILTKYSKKII